MGTKAKTKKAETIYPKERLNHDELVTVIAPIDGVGRGGVIKAMAARVVTQTTLDRLLHRRQIDKPLHDAGEQLQQSWYAAGLAPAITVNLLGTRGGKIDMTERQLIARQSFNTAMNGLGEGLKDIAYDVCCLDFTISKVEHDRNWRDGVGLVVLRLALTRLAKDYSLI